MNWITVDRKKKGSIWNTPPRIPPFFPGLVLLPPPLCAVQGGAEDRGRCQSQSTACCFCPFFLLWRNTSLRPPLCQCDVPPAGDSSPWTPPASRGAQEFVGGCRLPEWWSSSVWASKTCSSFHCSLAAFIRAPLWTFSLELPNCRL